MLPLSFASFLSFGVVLILVGANQSELAHHYALDLEGTGELVSAVALGVGVGVIGTGPLFDRISRRPLFVGALLLAALALSTVDASGSFGRLVVHMFAAGIGTGGYNTVINASVAERYGERSARPMAVVHSAATVGAMLGPAIIGALWGDDWSASFRMAGAGHTALAIGAALLRKSAFERVSVVSDPRAPGAAAPVRIPGSPAPEASIEEKAAPSPPQTAGVLSGPMIPFAGIAFAYVGIETSLGVFAIPYSAEFGLPTETGRLAISALWLGLLTGRLAVLVRRSAPDTGALLTAGALASALLAMGIGLSTPHVEVLFGLVGFALGAVYPVNMALTGQRFPNARGMAAGTAAGAGALGGFAVPWATGALGDAAGVGAALFSLAGWALLIVAFAASAARPRKAPRGMLRRRSTSGLSS